MLGTANSEVKGQVGLATYGGQCRQERVRALNLLHEKVLQTPSPCCRLERGTSLPFSPQGRPLEFDNKIIRIEINIWRRLKCSRARKLRTKIRVRNISYYINLDFYIYNVDDCNNSPLSISPVCFNLFQPP